MLLCTVLVSSTIYAHVASSKSVIQDEYPTGSLACKMFNESVLDCSRRNLPVIPSIGKHSASSLDLSDNKIEQIYPISFAGQTQLTSIDFFKNQLINITDSPFADLGLLVHLDFSVNKISYIASTAFTGLHNLEFLNISNNKLIILPDDVFRDLQSLKCLDLMTNQLTAVPGLALSALCNLESLNLFFNPFMSATFGPEFELLTHLSEFVFYSSRFVIPKLTNKTLQHLPLSSLRSVVFVWNPFTDVEAGIFERLKNIELLVSGINSPEQQQFPIPSSVKNLALHVFQSILSRNIFMPLSNLDKSLTSLRLNVVTTTHITLMKDFVFYWFPSLLHLDLSAAGEDRIDLSEDTFYGLGQLKSLSLAQTMLTSIPSVALQAFAQTGSLRQLDLSGNMLTGLFPDDAFSSVTSLEHLDMSYNPVTYLNKWIERLTNLTHLFLNGRNIHFLAASQWKTPLYSLIELQLGHFMMKAIPMFEELSLHQKAPNLEVLDVSDTRNIYRLRTIRYLSSLRTLDISGSLATLTEDIIFDQWSAIFYPDLKILKSARNRLKTMTKLYLYKTTPNVVNVDLSINLISSVDKNMKLLLNLEHLNLNDNIISSLDNFHNLAQMKSLRIAQNMINFVPETVVKNWFDSELEFLDMSNNPFECTCAIKPFQNWILTDRRVYLEPNLYRCESPIEYKDISVTQVRPDCRSYFRVHVSVAAACGVLVFLMAILTWRYRWHLRYRLFLLCNWHRMRYDDTDRDENDFEMVEVRYDAFVSYAHESDNDLEWVLNEMRPSLEEGPEPIRLCIGHARDFVPGTNLFDSITDAIHQSRKTIVVLSPSYVESELCYFETQHAWKRLLEEGRDVVVLILLESIPDEKMTIWLRQLLCKKGYLRWPHGKAGQQLFWRCVRKKLKKRTLVNRRFDA